MPGAGTTPALHINIKTGGSPMKTRFQVAFLTAGVIAGIGPALAVDEIVVTAQRREQQLQDVPVAVSAFNESSIEALQINVVKDIGQNVPNLQTYTVTAGSQAMQVHSRGASVQNPGFNASESPVGIYQDDVYFGRLASANLELADVERIEVLRGPQGTLYGRNTIAGAIKVITRTPGDDSWATASVGLGNYETYKVSGSVGGPIEEGSLAGSVAVLYDKRNEGWQDNPITDQEPGEYENRIGRAKLHWYGSENFDAVLSAWVANLENDGYNGVPYAPFVAADEERGSPLGRFYDNYSPSGANYGESDQGGGSLALTWNFGGATLKSISAFSSIDDKFGFDLGGGGAGGFPGASGLLVASDSEMDTLSQEFQLLGTAFGDQLDWLVGLYYMNEDGSQTYSGDLVVPGPFVVFDFAEDVDTDTDSYAAFAEGTWHFTDRFSVTGGARWTQDEKDYDNVCAGTTCVGGPVSLDEDFDEVTGKIGLNYQLSDQSLVYLTWSQGFQAGGFQTLCFGNLSVSCAGSFYDPQTVDSYELGIKSDLLDNTLRLNLATFYAMYEDIQQTGLFDPTPAAPGSGDEGFPLQNVGDVDVYGAEVEVTWTPIDNLSIFGFLGWQESDYDTLNPLASAALAGADELPSNPDLTGKIGFSYTVPMSELAELFYGADLYYSDEYYSTVDNVLLIDDYTRLNGFIGIGQPDERWQIVLSARNITDEEDNVSGIYFAGVTNIRTPLPPSEYMLTFKMKY
jgi:iron complex outermembrane receptor protein